MTSTKGYTMKTPKKASAGNRNHPATTVSPRLRVIRLLPRASGRTVVARPLVAPRD